MSVPTPLTGNSKYVTTFFMATGQSPTEDAFDAAVASADAGGPMGAYAWANSAVNVFAGMSNQDYAYMILDNMGLVPNPALVTEVANYMAANPGARGTITLQLSDLFLSMFNNPNAGLAALSTAWNNEVDASFAEWNGSGGPGVNLNLTTTANESIMGTAGDDDISGSASGELAGDRTYQGGDTVNGSGGFDTITVSLANGNYDNVRGISVEHLVVNASGKGDVTVDVTQYDSDLQLVTVDNESNGTVTIKGIQEDSSNSIDIELVDSTADVTLSYDSNEPSISGPATVVNVSVMEFGQQSNSAAMIITNDIGGLGQDPETLKDLTKGIETLNLDVVDIAGRSSYIQDITVLGIKTLNITGGLKGQDVYILDELDATLTTVNAGTFNGDLGSSQWNLNLGATKTATAVTLGKGNDYLAMGDVYGDNDTIRGGDGNDTLTVVFTGATDSDTTRKADMQSVETLNATFTKSVTFDGALVNDLVTANLNASAGRADFNNMDSTFTTVNVKGNLSQGVEVDFDGNNAYLTGLAKLTVNITGATEKINDLGDRTDAIRVINAEEFTLNHNGTKNVLIDGSIYLDDSSDNTPVTRIVNINNNSTADLEFIPRPSADSILVHSNDVQHVNVTTTSTGSIWAPDGSEGTDPFMDEAEHLQTLNVTANANSAITLGTIGNSDSANDLEEVHIIAGGGAWIEQQGIDARGWYSGAANIDFVEVTAGVRAEIGLEGDYWDANLDAHDADKQAGSDCLSVEGENWIEAGGISRMDITAASGAYVYGDVYYNGHYYYTGGDNAIGIDMTGQPADSKLTLSGAGYIEPIFLQDEAFSKIDASGLTGSSLVLLNTNVNSWTGDTSAAYEVIGTGGGDVIMGGDGKDTLSGGKGNDDIIGANGADSISGGDGDDWLIGDFNIDDSCEQTYLQRTGNGNDTIDGGAGNDYIEGGEQTAKTGFGDVLTGGEGDDTFFFDFYYRNDSGITTSQDDDNNKSPAVDKILDFNGTDDHIEMALDNGGPYGPDEFSVVYFASIGAAGSVIGGDNYDPIGVVLRRGTYNANGSFSQSIDGTSGDDLQMLVDTTLFDIMMGPITGYQAANLPTYFGGGTLYSEADHEIALIGAAANVGTINSTDFIFV